MPKDWITAFDSDGDSAWNLEEFSEFRVDVSPEGWRRDFDIADEDEDGYISESEGKDMGAVALAFFHATGIYAFEVFSNTFSLFEIALG